MSHQPCILAPVPTVGRALSFDLVWNRDPRAGLVRARDAFSIDGGVFGIGEPLALLLKHPSGLRAFPGMSGRGCSFPSTQHALWVFFGGSSESEVHDHARAFRSAVADDFVLREEVCTFKYKEGRDLTGYIDGTENPKDDAALEAAIAHDGSSFVAVQKWVHDLPVFDRLSPRQRDEAIGRAHLDNEELDDAPPYAHVKRTAQESFDPPAFVVRRSMPWGNVTEGGLYFVAYGESLDRFEVQLRRMAGLDDGIVDALLGFSRAVTGAYYFCPPIANGRLDLSSLV